MPPWRPSALTIPKEPTSSFLLTQSGTFQHGELAGGLSGPLAEACPVYADDRTGGASEEFGPMRSGLRRAAQRPGGRLAAAIGGTKAASLGAADDDRGLAALRLADLQDLGVLGSGSSGVARKVLHRPTGRLLCLKVIPFDVQSDQLRKQISAELHTLHGSRHPHIVAYYASFLQDGFITIAMEYMDGGTLGDLLKVRPRIPEPHLAQMARQVLSALLHLHRDLRVVHRDLKPTNLLLDRTGAMKLSDFGVSGQLENSMSQCASWVGTVTYMSPERIRGERYSFDSDIWSLGLTVVEAAIGRFPYPPQVAGRAAAPLGFWELLTYIVDEPAPVLPAGAFSRELRDFVAACLQKSPSARPTAAQLLAHPFLCAHPAGTANLADLLPPSTAALAASDMQSAPSLLSAAEQPRGQQMAAAGCISAYKAPPLRQPVPFSGTDSLI